MKRIIACLAVLAIAACAARHDKLGPLARGVSTNAPRDTIGVVLSWTPEQTIVNFGRADQIFAAHTIHHGGKVRALPRAAVQIDPVGTQSEGLPAMSVEQLMNSERITGVIAVKDGEIILERYAFGRGRAGERGSRFGTPYQSFSGLERAQGFGQLWTRVTTL